MIFYVSNHSYSKFSVVLKESEVRKIVRSIDWITDEHGFYVSKNSSLSRLEIKKIVEVLPNFDFLKEHFKIEIDLAVCESFSVLEYIQAKTRLAPKTASPLFSEQRAPIDHCPTFQYGEEFYLWKFDMGLFEVKTKNGRILGFYNPFVNHLVFKTLDQYDSYLNEINILKEKLSFAMNTENNDRYVRLINVYDKTTKELKYRILNQEFNYNSFAHFNLKPIENDPFFFGSYLITESLAEEYLEYTSLDIDFDFAKNEYYFETLNASNFVYATKDVF
jgi:hypothetical protein